MSDAIVSQGIKVYLGSTASPPVYTEIPEIKSISGPSTTIPMIDVTSLASDAKEYKPGLKDQGELQLTINWAPDNAVHGDLRDVQSDREVRPFKIEWTDASPVAVWTFDAYVMSFSVSASVDAVVEASVTLRITGDITEA